MTRGLSPTARLEARDQGARLHPVDRALVLLGLAAPDLADLAELPLGERDRRLLAHRRATFGDRIPCLVECPHCSATQEFDLSASDLIGGLEPAGEEELLEAEGWRVWLRPLASRDLAAAASQVAPGGAVAMLVACAVAEAEGPAGEGPDQMPVSLWPVLEARVAEREAAAEIALHLVCADCGHTWTAAFDIGSCFWSEVEADARRLLAEVATLAQRFGWSEAELLAMSPARRRAYLDLAGAS